MNPRVEISKEEIKRVDNDNIRYSIEVIVYTGKEETPTITIDGTATYIISCNSFHLNTETENELDEIGNSYGFDGYSIVEALEDRISCFDLN